MPAKSIKTWATEVAKMTFDEICKDNTLKNAVSKALAASHNKDSFDFFNDRGTSEQKFERFIQKSNDINISSDLVNQVTAVKDDPKELKKIMNGAIADEVAMLFKTNLTPPLLKSEAFATWVDSQNAPFFKASAKKAAKLLGIDDDETLAEAMMAIFNKNDGEAKKLLVKIEKAEKTKDLFKALEAAGLA